MELEVHVKDEKICKKESERKISKFVVEIFFEEICMNFLSYLLLLCDSHSDEAKGELICFK